MVGAAAFLGTLEVYRAEDVCGHLWNYGAELVELWKRLASANGVGDSITLEGPAASLAIVARDAEGQASGYFRALFAQEMVKHGVLMPWVAPSLSHGAEELAITATALDVAFSVYSMALSRGVQTYLEGPPLKPVFRRFN